MNIFPVIDRKPQVINRLGISKATFHIRLKDGLLPPPVPLGALAVGYLRHEYDQVIAAMVAGYSKEEIKTLVDELVEQRKKLPTFVKCSNNA